MNSPHIHFEHPDVGHLVVPTGLDQIAWSYNLNTANYPTYGGEVVQILSVYIDDISMGGMVRTYREAEEIYEFFAEYMIKASQGSNGNGSYVQSAMKVLYTPREWEFYIQPLSVPGFEYSHEIVAPTWHLVAHVKDNTAGNYQSLQEMAAMTSEHIANRAIIGKEDFDLKGIINPAAADPTQNPFSSPVTGDNGTFRATTMAETNQKTEKLADYYNKLIPAYIEGDYKTLIDDIGAKPVSGFGKVDGVEDEFAVEVVEPKKTTKKK